MNPLEEPMDGFPEPSPADNLAEEFPHYRNNLSFWKAKYNDLYNNCDSLAQIITQLTEDNRRLTKERQMSDKLTHKFETRFERERSEHVDIMVRVNRDLVELRQLNKQRQARAKEQDQEIRRLRLKREDLQGIIDMQNRWQAEYIKEMSHIKAQARSWKDKYLNRH